MNGKFFIFCLLMFLLAAFTAVAAEGDRHCSQEGFTHRCVEQVEEDFYYPCYMPEYGVIKCKEIQADKWMLLKEEMAGTDSQAKAEAGLIPTSFTNYDSPYNQTIEEDGKDKNITLYPALELDVTRAQTIYFRPSKGQLVTIGFASNVFNVTDFVNGTCDGCSIDVGVELTNRHYTQNRSGLVGEWLFTDDATDSSGMGNDGSASGAIHKHERYEFDGNDDYIAVTDDASLDLGTDNFTIEFWAWGNKADWMEIISKADDQYSTMTEGWSLGMDVGGTNLIFFTHSNSVDVTWSSQGDFLGDYKWHHWAFVGDREAGTITLYRDTASQGSQSPASFGDIQTTSPLRIGSAGGTLNRFWRGNLDEVRIWNRSLSAQEVNQSYNNSLYRYANESVRTAIYTSLPLNGTQRVTWTNITINQTNRTATTIQTRTSNDNATWDPWTSCSWLTADTCLIGSTPGFYLQYRATIGTDNHTFTPVLYNINISCNPCIETWTCTDCIKNLSDNVYYSECVDTSACGTIMLKPPSGWCEGPQNKIHMFIIAIGLAVVLLLMAFLVDNVLFGVASAVMFLISAALLFSENILKISSLAGTSLAAIFMLIGLYLFFKMAFGGDN